jgi:uncharacterized protein
MLGYNKDMLLKQEAFNHKVNEIQLRETHISFVYLTGNYVYKVKKQIKFGDILDFSTLEKRKEYCELEIKLNSRFSPEVYINRVGISSEGKIVSDDSNDVIEYAVKMHQLPEDRLLNRILDDEKDIESIIESVALKLAEFHETTEKIPEHGSPERNGSLWEKWDENFRTTETFRKESDEFKELIFSFYNTQHLTKRVEENRIADNHGDLQANNIFAISKDDIKIVDCIDFNPMLRYGDVAEDVCFLAMELDFLGKTDLSKKFVQSYIKHSGDESLFTVLDFYKCYRAYVRGKVYGFQSVHEQDENKKKQLWELSDKYYNLAYNVSKNIQKQLS